MKQRILACVLVLTMLTCTLCAALADTTYTARTPMIGYTSAKRNNVKLAAEAIDGYEVDSGDAFSFNEAVGPRTQYLGYRSAENGRGVNVVGGGVAQAASTLYMALLKIGGGIKYTDLSTYGYRFTDNYVDDGDLAVITDYNDGIDFRFVNHVGDMRLGMWVSGNYLYCSVTVEDSNSSSWFGDDDDDDDDGYMPGLEGASVDVDDNDSDTMHNVKLAAASVYDTTLAHGDRFSFNKVVGPRTEKYGYISGTNGRGVRVMGGGVAQVASAIWLAVKDRDDISIIEKSTYGKKYNQNYVDSSADAIVTDYKAGTDFSFKYTGSGSITLYTYVNGDELRCDIAVNK